MVDEFSSPANLCQRQWKRTNETLFLCTTCKIESVKENKEEMPARVLARPKSKIHLSARSSMWLPDVSVCGRPPALLWKDLEQAVMVINNPSTHACGWYNIITFCRTIWVNTKPWSFQTMLLGSMLKFTLLQYNPWKSSICKNLVLDL